MAQVLSFFSRKRLLSFIPLFVTALVIAGLIYILPTASWGEALRALRSLPLFYWVYIASTIVINTGVVALRLKIMASYSGNALSFSSAFKVITTTMLTGVCAPFIGGLLGQKWALRHQGGHLAVPTYLFDKVIMAGVGGVLSLWGVFILWPNAPLIETLLSWQFTQKVIGSLCVVVALFLFFLTRKEKESFYRLFTRQTLYVFIKLCALSALSWAMMASTFLGGLFYFMPCAPFIKSLSASVMVSFLASMPISVSGWSVREFFAIEIFKFLDLPQSQALGLSIGIGAISLITVMILGGVFAYKNYKGSSFVQEKKPENSYSVSPVLIRGLMYGACVFVFFQYCIPVGPATVNFCPADLAACCGFVIGIPLLWKNRLVWHFISLRAFVCSTLLIFLLSFVIGWARFGWSSWALSKVLGWAIMLGYAMLSTLFIQQEGRQGMRRVVSLLTSTLVCVIFFEILCQWGTILFNMPHLFKGSFTGFTNNRNAFGIQTLVTLVLVYCLLYKPNRKHTSWAIAILLLGIQCTWSRSCQGVMAGLVGAAFFFHILCWRDICQIVPRFIAMNALYFLGIYACVFIATLSLGTLSLGTYSGETSDHERWYTMYEGLKLWWSYPLWGAGLGAFVIKELTLKNNFLIIHNSPIWILAECGLAGASVFSRFIYQTIHGLCTTYSPQIEKGRTYGLWGIFLTVGALSMVHEVLYQKIIWIALGLLLAKSSLKAECGHPLLPLASDQDRKERL
jgi:hypothetical protein